MKKVIAVTLSLVFLWFVSSPQSIYADTNNKRSKKMSVGYKEFAGDIKKKYPEYVNEDDRILAEKIIAKYPEYKDYVYFDLKTKPINIAFCFNENLWMQAGVAITSLLCTAEEKCCYNIYCVVPDSVNQTMRNILESLVKKRSSLSSIKFLTVTNQMDGVESAEKRATYYRLLLPKLLPDLDKIIYTDVDVTFNDNLQEMDKIDISKYYVAGVIDSGIIDFYKNTEIFQGERRKICSKYCLYDIIDNGQYLNAGVLILNLKKIRQDGIDKKWFEIINIDFPLLDQDVINISCAGSKLLLSNSYNSQYNSQFDSSSKILHYPGPNKPWEIRHEGTPTPKCWELWWYYAEKTPFTSCFMKNMMQKQYDVMKDMMQREYDDRFKVLPKWLSRVFCWFIPKKEARHQFRKKYMTK